MEGGERRRIRQFSILVFRTSYGERGVSISPEELAVIASTDYSWRTDFLMELDRFSSY